MIPSQSAIERASITRPQLFAALYSLGCANGLAVRMVWSIREHGMLDATLGTFDISLILLAACFAGVSFISRDKCDAIRPADVAVSVVFVALLIVPVTSLSWLAVATLSLHILFFSDSGEEGRRGAKIFLASAVPMLLVPWLFALFSKAILEADAVLVSWVLGTGRSGIFVEFADRSGLIAIYPGCSSLPNMALAFLCWVTVSQSVGHKWRAQDAVWLLLAVASVGAVNVARMSVMGLHASYYAALHNPAGNIPTNILILCFTIGFCVLGARREIFQRS